MAEAGWVVALHADTMGRGDDALGARILGAFIRTCAMVEPRPSAIVFYNAAVKLLAEGTPHLEALRALDDAGVDLLACVTCLEHFALTQRLAVGEVSNMREIVQRLANASKVVTI